MGIALRVGFGVCFFSWMLCLISTVLPYWSYQNQGRQIIHVGLWKNCTVVHGRTSCVTPSEGWMHAVQVLMVLAIVVLTLSIISGGITMKDESRRKIALMAALSAILAGVLVTCAVVYFGEKNKQYSSSFSAAFGLAAITCVTSLIAGALFGLSRRNAGYTQLAL